MTLSVGEPTIFYFSTPHTRRGYLLVQELFSDQKGQKVERSLFGTVYS